jgi:hypothetical protein
MKISIINEVHYLNLIIYNYFIKFKMSLGAQGKLNLVILIFN